MSHKAESRRANANARIDEVERVFAHRNDYVGRESAMRHKTRQACRRKRMRDGLGEHTKTRTGLWWSREPSAASRCRLRRTEGNISKVKLEGIGKSRPSSDLRPIVASVEPAQRQCGA